MRRDRAFLINFHRVDTKSDAEAYIARLKAISVLFGLLEVNLKARQAKGVLPPAFVFPHVLRDRRNIVDGAPFTDGDDSTILADFKRIRIRRARSVMKLVAPVTQIVNGYASDSIFADHGGGLAANGELPRNASVARGLCRPSSGCAHL